MKRIFWAASWMILSIVMCYSQEGIQPFLGNWNLAGDGKLNDHIYWLEVKIAEGKPEILFLNRGSGHTDLHHRRTPCRNHTLRS